MTDTIKLSGRGMWDYGMHVLIQDPVEGNWEYSDPKYDGDGFVRKVEMSASKWIDPENKGLLGRDVGSVSGLFEVRE